MRKFHVNSWRRSAWGRMLLLLSVAAVCLLATTKPANSENAEQGNERKLVSRVEPEYPETLRRLYIGGVVKVDIVVSPAGNVESTQLIGGNPILGQAAMKAIKQWKYAPAGAKSRFTVKFEFDPHNN
jgi:TonB family protein